MKHTNTHFCLAMGVWERERGREEGRERASRRKGRLMRAGSKSLRSEGQERKDETTACVGYQPKRRKVKYGKVKRTSA